MKRNETFELYLKQAVEDLVGRKISLHEFKKARAKAEKLPAVSMQERIERISFYCAGQIFFGWD